MKKIEIETWSRREQFYNFLNFEDPFFNLCAEVDVKLLKEFTLENEESFFLTSYYLLLKVVNCIDEFKLRIREKDVVLHDRIKGSCPILKSDDTFGYGYFSYFDEFGDFKSDAKRVIQNVKNGEPFDPKFDEDDLIHSSVIPWVSFRSFEHAKRLNQGDSIPKIVMGKSKLENDKLLMPVSVSGHHSLMDGLHVGKFFTLFQELLSNPERELK